MSTFSARTFTQEGTGRLEHAVVRNDGKCMAVRATPALAEQRAAELNEMAVSDYFVTGRELPGPCPRGDLRGTHLMSERPWGTPAAIRCRHCGWQAARILQVTE